MTDLVKSSFNITYALLMTTGTITFIEALRTDDIPIRHIMNVETCISLVACFFYNKFIDMIKTEPIDYNMITKNRYIDWSITTPLMILSLLLFISYNLNTPNKSTDYKKFVVLILFNFLMLIFGYMGETKKINEHISSALGFTFFIILFSLIYYWYIKGHNVSANDIIYWLYVIIWAFYGVAAKLKPELKNTIYNILDVISKCFIGLGFWAYFTKVFS